MDVVASKKKKVNTRFSMVCATQPWLDCPFFSSCSKFFSALEIKDNSKFNKGQGQGGSNKGLSFEIKDGWQPYVYLRMPQSVTRRQLPLRRSRVNLAKSND